MGEGAKRVTTVSVMVAAVAQRRNNSIRSFQAAVDRKDFVWTGVVGPASPGMRVQVRTARPRRRGDQMRGRGLTQTSFGLIPAPLPGAIVRLSRIMRRRCQLRAASACGPGVAVRSFRRAGCHDLAQRHVGTRMRPSLGVRHAHQHS